MEFLAAVQLLNEGDKIELTIEPSKCNRDNKDYDGKFHFSINSVQFTSFYNLSKFSKTMTDFLENELKTMIAKSLKDLNPKFQTVDVNISNVYNSNRIDVNFPKSKMTLFLNIVALLDFVKLCKNFNFVFDFTEKKNFGFVSSEYYDKFPLLKTGSGTFDFNISDSNVIYYYDKNYKTNIFIVPEVGTRISHSTENVTVTFLENNKISVTQQTHDIAKESKETEKKEKKLKYLFVRNEISTSSFQDYGVDRVINQYGKMVWIDEVTNKLITISLVNFTFFDEKTQKNVEIYKGGLHPRDPEVQIVLRSSLKEKYTQLGNDFDFILQEDSTYSPEYFPNGEYTDFVTLKKFKMKDGKIILSKEEKKKEEKKYWVMTFGLIKDTLAYINNDNKKSKNYLVQLSGRKLVELNENDQLVETNIETGFTFLDERSQNTYTFTENGYNVITHK